MAPPVSGKSPAKKQRSTAKQPAAGLPVAPRNLPNFGYRVAPSSLATGATKHGNIDDDGKTQASVLAHIQGKPIPAP